MDSIWSNTFYKSQPALSWVYKVSFAQYFGGSVQEFPIEYMNILSKAIVDIQVGKRESEYTSVYYGGLEFKKLTRAINSNNFTIKFNENKYYKVTEILERIYNMNNLSQLYPESDGSEKDPRPYNTKINAGPNVRYKLIVHLMDPNNLAVKEKQKNGEYHEMARYEFYGCQLVSIDDITLSYESTEAISRSASFVYDYMKFYNKDEVTAMLNASRKKVNDKIKNGDFGGGLAALEKAQAESDGILYGSRDATAALQSIGVSQGYGTGTVNPADITKSLQEQGVL